MATLLEYFDNDFKDMRLDRPLTLTFSENDHNNVPIAQHSYEIKESIYHKGESSSRFLTYYIPEVPDVMRCILSILSNLSQQISLADSLEVIGGFFEDVQLGLHRTIYSNRIYIYTENPLSQQELIYLNEYSQENGLHITIRSIDYLNNKIRMEKPLAFISHDSKDKELIARKLASGLNSRLCYVWYDEYSLKVGDSLRESIETGIKEAKKCVLILTKNFLTNPGWGKKEFNSIFTREMITEEKVILPIWHGVTKQEVYEYSPSLADTFALTWPSPENKTIEQYNEEIEQLISNIHVAITG